MRKKDYKAVQDAILELKHSGITSGVTLNKVVNRLALILDTKFKNMYANYKSDKFLKKLL